MESRSIDKRHGLLFNVASVDTPISQRNANSRMLSVSHAGREVTW